MQDLDEANSSLSDNNKIVYIGQSLFIRGELIGSTDMAIDGKVEGEIDLTEYNLTIGPMSRIQAKISAKTVLVQGEITGDIIASERVELAANSRVEGDIITQRITIADSARLKGSVDISGVQQDPPSQPVLSRTSSAPGKPQQVPASNLARQTPAYW